MKAVIRNSTTVGDISLKEIPIPKPTGTYLLAKVAYAGICASDIDILNNRNDIYKPPVVQGHEFSAIIEEIGDQVVGFKKGDLITSETTLDVEGEPNAHLLPNYQLMAGKRIVGWTVNGGFAEYVLLNSLFCHKFSPETNPKVAALCEPTAIATESVMVRGNVKPEESVMVIGPGPIGILCALVARFFVGAEKTFLVGLPSDSYRLNLAKKLGLEHCYTTDEDLAEILKQNTAGNLADVVINATGSIKGFELSLNLTKRTGRIIEAGSITEDTMFSWERAAYLALTLTFVFSSSNKAWKFAIDFINNTHLELERLVSKSFALEDYQNAFEMATNTKENIKILFKPDFENGKI